MGSLGELCAARLDRSDANFFAYLGLVGVFTAGIVAVGARASGASLTDGLRSLGPLALVPAFGVAALSTVGIWRNWGAYRRAVHVAKSNAEPEFVPYFALWSKPDAVRLPALVAIESRGRAALRVFGCWLRLTTRRAIARFASAYQVGAGFAAALAGAWLGMLYLAAPRSPILGVVQAMLLASLVAALVVRAAKEAVLAFAVASSSPLLERRFVENTIARISAARRPAAGLIFLVSVTVFAAARTPAPSENVLVLDAAVCLVIAVTLPHRTLAHPWPPLARGVVPGSSVRRAEESDEAAISEVLRECFQVEDKGESIRAVRDELARGHLFIVATDGASVVGFASWTRQGLFRHGLVEISRVCVKPDARKSGHGSRLVRAVIADCRAAYEREHAALRKIYVLTHATNAAAARLYKRAAFQLEGSLPNHFRAEQEECVYALYA